MLMNALFMRATKDLVCPRVCKGSYEPLMFDDAIITNIYSIYPQRAELVSLYAEHCPVDMRIYSVRFLQGGHISLSSVRVNSCIFRHQVNSDTHLQTV